MVVNLEVVEIAGSTLWWVAVCPAGDLARFRGTLYHQYEFTETQCFSLSRIRQFSLIPLTDSGD